MSSLAATIRSRVGAVVRTALGAGPGDLDEYAAEAGDPGLFGPDSMVWRVHGDLPAMLVGGFTALIAQTLHPLAMAGVAGHSNYRADPLGRLRRTARFVAGTSYGPMPFVDSLVTRVRAVHGTVRGTAVDGRPYAADDPALLRFVHTTEVASFLAAYQRYAPAPLLRAEKDRYLDEVAVVAELLGATDVPRDLRAVRRYFDAIAGELELTEQARDALVFLEEPTGSGFGEHVAHAVIFDAARDLLPEPFRDVLGAGRRRLVPTIATRAAAATLAGTLRFAIGPSAVRAVAEERVRAVTAPR
jgi:uncharacterized protein (DUF2236 family)